MAEENKLKTFRVLFKEGHTTTVRAYGFDQRNHYFRKADGQPDPDILVNFGSVLSITPVEREETSHSSLGVRSY
jgi:hypothetical protein